MTFLRNFLTQSGLTAISRILGLIRDILIASRLGAGPIADAWFTALQLPNLFRRTLAEGAFSQAFIPAYTQIRKQHGTEKANQIASETLSVLLTLTLGISIAFQLAMPWIMLALQAGYAHIPKIFDLSILLARITMPYLTGMACASLFAGILNAHGKFAASAFAPSLFNLCLIAAATQFSQPIPCAIASSIAVSLSGLLQALLLWHASRKAGIQLRFSLPKITPEIQQIISLAIPGALASSATQINILISQSIASLEHGAKSWLAFADRLYQLPLGMIGVAIGVTILPKLSKSRQHQHTLDTALLLAIGLSLPASAALMILPEILINGLFGHGEFSQTDVQMAASALFHFAWGAPAFILVKLLAASFFAQQNTLSPMRFALISIACNISLGTTLFFWMQSQNLPGFIGLAIATSSASWLNAAMLAASLIRKKQYQPGKQTLSRLLRIAGATSLMSLILIWQQQHLDHLSKENSLVLTVITGIIAYATAARFCGILKVSDITRAWRKSS